MPNLGLCGKSLQEGTSIDDFVLYLKAEYLDAVYLQQDAYDPVDGATTADRQQHVFDVISNFLKTDMQFEDKAAARHFFHQLTQTTRDWNRIDMKDEEFNKVQARLEEIVSGKARNA